MFRVLSLNTWNTQGPWEKRWRVIAQGIQSAKPDVIGFQELFDASWAEKVLKKLRYCDYYFASDSAGNVIYSRYPMSKKIFKRYETKSVTESYWRYVVGVQIEIQNSSFWLFNTHLSWKLDEGSVRQAQVSELLTFVSSHAGSCPVIVTGDFNAVPTSPEVKALIESGFVDSYAAGGSDERAITWDNKNPFAAGASHELPDRRIDYVFFKQGAKAQLSIAGSSIIYKEPGADGIYASDHYGVLTTIKG